MISASGQSDSFTIPVPVGGWNKKSPKIGMQDIFALKMTNFFPDEQEISVRNGDMTFLAASTFSAPVKTLVEHNNEAGDSDFLMGQGGAIYDITAATRVLLGNGFSENSWQTVQMNNNTLLFNGTDQPQKWDGTTLTAATYTGIADDSLLIQATTYNNQLFAVEKDSQSVWYGQTDQLTGALQEWFVGANLQMGGEISFVTTFSPPNDTLTEYMTVVSENGEVLAYAGDSPTFSSWQLVTRSSIPKPLSRRSFVRTDSDVEILTQTGSVSLAQAFSKRQVSETVTDLISPEFLKQVKLYSDVYGWEACYHTLGKKILYNIPQVVNTRSIQFVKNSLTGAWCDFAGWNATCFCVFNDKLYYGTGTGIVKQADVGNSDSGANIEAEVQFAYNYLGSDLVKQVNSIIPYITATGNTNLQAAFDVDFQEGNFGSISVSVGGSQTAWDSVLWDTSFWSTEESTTDDLQKIDGVGTAFSLRLKGAFKDISLKISAVKVLFTQGGAI